MRLNSRERTAIRKLTNAADYLTDVYREADRKALDILTAAEMKVRCELICSIMEAVALWNSPESDVYVIAKRKELNVKSDSYELAVRYYESQPTEADSDTETQAELDAAISEGFRP